MALHRLVYNIIEMEFFRRRVLVKPILNKLRSFQHGVQLNAILKIQSRTAVQQSCRREDDDLLGWLVDKNILQAVVKLLDLDQS